MRLHWIWLATRAMGDGLKGKLLARFHDPEELYHSDSEAYAAVEGMTPAALRALEDKDLAPCQQIWEECQRLGIQVITIQDPAYPKKLAHIPDPPVVLYCKGRLPQLQDIPAIGVVGTRKASIYGLNAAKRMGYQIARCGGAVVSGMAYGIDAMAMSGALSGDGTVVAVLGCGVDQVYPKSNRGLYDQMVDYGCLISEFAPGTPPYSWNFPRRNRVLSGLCDGILVVEAPAKSGALNTANHAAEQGRDVFVVPGNIDVDSCAGSNALLRDGAIAVCSGWDVVGEYAAIYPGKVRPFTGAEPGQGGVQEPKATTKVAQKSTVPENSKDKTQKVNKKLVDNPAPGAYSDKNDPPAALSQEERQVLTAIPGEGIAVDDLIDRVGLSAGRVLAIMTMLQVKGMVAMLPGRRVGRK